MKQLIGYWLMSTLITAFIVLIESDFSTKEKIMTVIGTSVFIALLELAIVLIVGLNWGRKMEVKNINDEVNKTLYIAKVEQIHEYRKWCSNLPYFNFDKEWDVKIIPPFAGAIIRFYIKHGNKDVSVYFDGYSELGLMYDDDEKPIPYFECLFSNIMLTRRYLIDESEQMMDDIREYLNEEQKG